MAFKQLRHRWRDHIKVQAVRVGGPFYLLQELKWFFRPVADLFSDLCIVRLLGLGVSAVVFLSWLDSLLWASFCMLSKLRLATRLSSSAFVTVMLGPALSWYVASSSVQMSTSCGSFSVSEWYSDSPSSCLLACPPGRH